MYALRIFNQHRFWFVNFPTRTRITRSIAENSSSFIPRQFHCFEDPARIAAISVHPIEEGINHRIYGRDKWELARVEWSSDKSMHNKSSLPTAAAGNSSALHGDNLRWHETQKRSARDVIKKVDLGTVNNSREKKRERGPRDNRQQMSYAGFVSEWIFSGSRRSLCFYFSDSSCRWHAQNWRRPNNEGFWLTFNNFQQSIFGVI